MSDRAHEDELDEFAGVRDRLRRTPRTDLPSAPPMVLVEWEDATNCAVWTDREEATSFELDSFNFDWRCTSVGYLLRDDDECVIVAARATGDFKSVGLFERIPRGMVKSVTTLKPGGRRTSPSHAGE